MVEEQGKPAQVQASYTICSWNSCWRKLEEIEALELAHTAATGHQEFLRMISGGVTISLDLV